MKKIFCNFKTFVETFHENVETFHETSLHFYFIPWL